MNPRQRDPGEPTVLLQLSDPHLLAEEGEPDQRLRRVVAAAGELLPRPAAILLSGDVADEPGPAVYERARAIVAELGLPVHAIPGNHDDRDLLAAAFAGHERAGGTPVNVLADVGALRLLGADTTLPGSPDGELGAVQLEWIANALRDEPARPTLLALHHPPVASGIRGMDEIGIEPGQAAALEALLAEHPQVLAVTCGHVHRILATSFAGRPLMVCPSTNSTLRLDLRARDDLPLVFDEQPVGFAVHALVAGRLVSHVQTLASG